MKGHCAYKDMEEREVKTHEAWKALDEKPICECGYAMIGISKQTGISWCCADPLCLLPTKFIKYRRAANE